MKHCSECGTAVELKTPEGDNRLRYCCPCCGAVHYINPKIVVGTIPVYNNQVLLCRRAIEPRYGFWTLPAGFMELQETTHDGAIRETLEEAGTEVTLGPLFTMFDVIHANQVHLFFRAHMKQAIFSSGTESLEVQLFHEHKIPWDELAFQTVRQTLKLFFADRKKGHFGLYTGDLNDPTAWPLLETIQYQ